jgi:hypothetical protein
MAKQKPLKQFFYNNGLSILMFSLFILFLIGQSIAGYQYNNEELKNHQQIPESYAEYIKSGEFIEAVFENWESEFLQMAALVIATIFLHQKGAADSKKLRGKEPVDQSSRYSIINASSWNTRKKAVRRAVYSNSLSIVLICLFLLSFGLHAIGGVEAHNQEAMRHGEDSITVMTYVQTSQFWFESFQNWQSEFLSVGVLLVLSIYLRQHKSSESKPIGTPNSKTGKE